MQGGERIMIVESLEGGNKKERKTVQGVKGRNKKKERKMENGLKERRKEEERGKKERKKERKRKKKDCAMVRNEKTKKGMPSKEHPLMVMMNKKLFSLCLFSCRCLCSGSLCCRSFSLRSSLAATTSLLSAALACLGHVLIA